MDALIPPLNLNPELNQVDNPSLSKGIINLNKFKGVNPRNLL
jgi:hypothetical protein